MPKIEKSITINAKVDKVFNYVTEPMNQVDWVTSLVEISDVTGSGVGQNWRWKYKMVGVGLEGESTCIEHVPNERRVTQTKGGVTSTWIFNFEPDEGRTKLKLDLEYTIPVPVVGKLAEKLVLKRNNREADLALANIKDTMEG
jgi:uncharacterized membrane protein